MPTARQETAALSRRVRYSAAMSLDGYIAGPAGEYDWIIMDPTVDFAAMFARYDTFLMGRKTYAAGGSQMAGGSAVYVFSRTLDPADHPGVRIVADGAGELVRKLKTEPGKDIWLFGGGELFRSLLAEQVVDALDVAVIPVLLGGGIPFLAAPADRVTLELEGSRIHPTGIARLEYAVRYPTPKPKKAGKKAT
jgi:dihydrofolate reductase